MKKLNNKGISVVEVVVTFAILMVIVVGLLNIIVELKKSASDKNLDREIVEYRNTLTQLIQNDLIKKRAKAVSNTCTGVTTTKKTPCYTITYNDNTKKQLLIDMSNKQIRYDGINYKIPSSSIVEFRDKAVFYPPTDIYNIDISIKNSILKIYIPYYIVDQDVSIGIDIAYPIGL